MHSLQQDGSKQDNNRVGFAFFVNNQIFSHHHLGIDIYSWAQAIYHSLIYIANLRSAPPSSSSHNYLVISDSQAALNVVRCSGCHNGSGPSRKFFLLWGMDVGEEGVDALCQGVLNVLVLNVVEGGLWVGDHEVIAGRGGGYYFGPSVWCEYTIVYRVSRKTTFVWKVLH